MSTGNARGIKLMGTNKFCEDCALGKVKKAAIRKTAVAQSKIKNAIYRYYSPSIACLGCKKYWLLALMTIPILLEVIF